MMGAHYLSYITPEADHLTCIIEQGQEIGKDASISVRIDKYDGEMTVSITGTAVFVEEMTVEL